MDPWLNRTYEKSQETLTSSPVEVLEVYLAFSKFRYGVDCLDISSSLSLIFHSIKHLPLLKLDIVMD